MIELNRIYNEDCLEGMKRIPDGVRYDLCDLPYGTTACKWDTIISNHCGSNTKELQWGNSFDGTTTIFKHYGIKQFNVVQIFFSLEEVKTYIFCTSAYRFMSEHEDILIFFKRWHSPKMQKNRMKYNPQGVEDTYRVEKRWLNLILDQIKAY